MGIEAQRAEPVCIAAHSHLILARARRRASVVLGISRPAAAERGSGRTVQAPMFEVDPLWPKPLPNHWLLGMTIGVWVDDQDHVWIIHRGAATLHANERALELKRRRVLPRPRRRSSSSTRRAISCARGAARARATSGRSRTTASTSTTRATCGSAATARRTRTSSSSPRTASS